MALTNQILQLEFQAANLTRRAYQTKVRTGQWATPYAYSYLEKAYRAAYASYNEAQPQPTTLAGLVELYRSEASKHFKGIKPGKPTRPPEVPPQRWAAARGGPIGIQAAQSDAFIRYWLYSFANRGILSAAFESGKYTRKVWTAQMDVYTSDICSHLNGEVRPVDSDYSFANFTGLAPPAHFRCRSLIRLLP